MRLSERVRQAGRAVAALRRLPSRHRLPFARCWWALLSTRLRLRIGGFVASGPLLRQGLAGRYGPRRTDLSEAELLAVFHAAMGAQVVAVPCLARSLALVDLLGRHGLPARIEIGMRKAERGLEGHAWVEREGRVMGETAAFVRSFVRFTRAT